jgi:hypothetical protein
MAEKERGLVVQAYAECLVVDWLLLGCCRLALSDFHTLVAASFTFPPTFPVVCARQLRTFLRTRNFDAQQRVHSSTSTTTKTSDH